MSNPLLQSSSSKPYVRFPGQPYTANTRFSGEWGRCLHDNVKIGQILLGKFGQIPSVTEWKKVFSFEISDELSDDDDITWEDTGNTISVARMKRLQQMAVDLAFSHPMVLFGDSWMEAENAPPLTPDGTAWSAAISCLGNLWMMPVSASAPVATPAPATRSPLILTVPPLVARERVTDVHRYNAPVMVTLTRIPSTESVWTSPRLSENTIGIYMHDNENEHVLDHLRRNDPVLKELTLDIPTRLSPASTQMFLNTSMKEIRIATRSCDMKVAVGIALSSPNVEAVTIHVRRRAPSINDITAVAQVLRVATRGLSLTIEGFQMDSDKGAAFAAAFQGNQTIKTLIMKRSAINATGAVSFVEALPHDHSLEAIVIEEEYFNGDSVVSIVRTLCHTPLKVLSLVPYRGFSEITQNCCTRIVNTLKENEHSFTKLDLFRDSQDSPWQNKIRLEIDLLTLNNCLLVEKDTWADQFLEQDAHTHQMLSLALERANKVDKERFSKAPNMLFYLIKAAPNSIMQAVRHGH